jgi:hypothetical protein
MTKQILAFVFCFTRELNLYCPLTFSLRPPIHPYLTETLYPPLIPIPPATHRQVVKRFKEKTLYYYIQECLSVQDVKMILHPC